MRLSISILMRWVAIALSCICLLQTTCASAQTYPARPIKVIIPFAPGNTGEIALRGMIPNLERILGQRMILDHRTGAAGNIAAQAVISATPDGYTLLLGATNNFAVNQYLIRDMTFDPLKALIPITAIVESPPVIFINSSVPASNLREFVTYVKANPGKLNYGSSGIGTTPHLAVELLMQRADISLVHVPFRGSPPAMAALLANDVQVFLVGLSAGIGQINAGRLRVLAVTSKKRLPGAPDIPTVSESGYPNFEATNRWTLAAPAGTDPLIVMRIADAVHEALKDPEVQRFYSDNGFIPVGNSPTEIANDLQAEAKQWKQLIDSRGIKSD